MNNSTNELEQALQKTITWFYFVDFIICSVLTFLITQTVWKNSDLRKEVRFFLLCQHLISLTLFFGLGTISNGLQAYRINALVILCWILFAVQIAMGRAVLLTLLLMSLNTCIAVCWPLKYLPFVHSVKIKIIVCLWVISFINPIGSLIYQGIKTPQEHIMSLDPNCPSTLGDLVSRIIGIIFIIMLVSIIFVCYSLIYREGKRAGHFNSSNQQASRTIIIHGLQIALHIIPTLVNIWIGGRADYIIVRVVFLIVFSFAQCLSPVVYGLRCTELRHKFIVQQQRCCAIQALVSYGSNQFTVGYSDG